MNDFAQKIRWHILAIALLVAISIHFFAIYSLKNVTFSPFLPSQAVQPTNNDSFLLQNIEKNRALAKTLNNITYANKKTFSTKTKWEHKFNENSFDPTKLLTDFSILKVEKKTEEPILGCFVGENLLSMPSISNRSLSLNRLLLSDIYAKHNSMNKTNTTLSKSDHFTIQIEEYAKNKSGNYFCKIDVKPNSFNQLKRLKQLCVFILNPISNEHFIEIKDHLLSALNKLHEEDSFSIYILDEKTSSFAKDPLRANKKNIALAKTFLKRQKKISGSSELQKLLDELNLATDDSANNIAYYLTNEGDQQSFFSGSIFLYPISTGVKNLAKVIEDLKYPIANQIFVTVYPKSKDTNITVYPFGEELPPLFESQKYTFFVELTQKDDFTLFLQGSNIDQWLDVKKDLSLATRSLKHNPSILKEIEKQVRKNP